MEALVFILLSVILYYGFALAVNFTLKRDSKVEDKGNFKESITLIIPFRNEAQRLDKLLASLAQSDFDIPVIWVDDHSSDASSVMIKKQWRENYLLLNSTGEGKKDALFTGISAANSKFIWTMDADISFTPEFITTVLNSLRNEADLVILPLNFSSKSFASKFWSWESSVRQRLFDAFGTFFHPLTASGANLIFKKSVYQASLNERTDWSWLSGDDHFLLEAVRKTGVQIQILRNPELAVTTPSASSWTEGLSQRLRWWTKTRHKPDRKGQLYGLIVLISQLGVYSAFISCVVSGQMYWSIAVFLLKMDADGWILGKVGRDQFSTREVFVFELLFPLYVVAFSFSLFTVRRTKWKGRSIKKPTPY